MANRSYLYAIEKENQHYRGIGECNYDIPLVFKILVSSNTQMIPSKIFQSNELIALKGDFETGKKRLYDFLDKLSQELSYEDIDSKVQKTKQFFESIHAEYFYLDCAEIYDMDSVPLGEQNKKQFYEINDIDVEIERFCKRLNDVIIKYRNMKNAFPSKGLFLNKRKDKAQKELDKIKKEIDNLLFLDYWTNLLYYDIKI